MLRPMRAAISIAACVAMIAVPEAQEPSLQDVLTRATDYVSQLNDQLSGTVAEERYEQRATTPTASGFGRFRNDTVSTFRRTLKSDYLIVRPVGASQYFGFRDVFEVDGHPVRDRDERLARLFLDPSASADRQIYGILSESARYNIGNVERNFNTPTLALLFLQDAYKPRFTFERASDKAPRLGLDVEQSANDVWVIEYREDWPTTVIRGRDRENLPATGRFWIEPTTGRVLASELTLKSAEVDVTISVGYDADQKLGHFVPAKMRERYENRAERSYVEGTATYTDFRRFQVQVEESEPFRD